MNLNKTLVAAAAVVALAGGTTAAVANSSSATLASTSNKISAEHTSRTSTPAANTAALANTNTKDTRGETKRAKTSHNSDQRNPKQENRTRQETTGAHRGSKKRQGAKAVMGALGVTKDELAAARKADKSLEELAADKGISKTDLVAKLTAKTKKRLSKAVADGKLTQRQADIKMRIITKKVERQISQKPSELSRGAKRTHSESSKEKKPDTAA